MKKFPAQTIRFHGLFLLVMALCSLSLAQEKLVFPFGAAASFISPFSSPALDSTGHLYVVSQGNNTDAVAILYQLTPPAAGAAQWGVLNVASIPGQMNAGVTIDHEGHLYGVTSTGGTNGTGFIFQIVNEGCCGGWPVNIFYNFPASAGLNPASGLTLDASGNLYGASYYAPSNCGSIFELQRVSSKVRTESTLYAFTGGADGCSPSGVILDQHGNLFGQTVAGGANQNGTIFELIPPGAAGGSWTEQTIYTFPAVPAAPALKARQSKQNSVAPKGFAGYYENTLTIDSSGNLYGTSALGGASGNGFVFELTPPTSGGSWTFSTLYSFSGTPDGSLPAGGLVRASNGVLYGTTYFGGPVTKWGGSSYGIGTVFQLSPSTSGGPWTEKILHNFTAGFDGYYPAAAPILSPTGVLYGTTQAGGDNGANCSYAYISNGCGIVFQITP